MNSRRWISLVALVAFLPVAAGCSAERSHRIHSGAADRGPGAKLRAGEEVEIRGYATADGAVHEWFGVVSPAGPDSLRFEAADTWAKSMTLPRQEVEALVVREVDGPRTVLGVVAVAALSLLVIGIIALSNSADDLDDEI